MPKIQTAPRRASEAPERLAGRGAHIKEGVFPRHALRVERLTPTVEIIGPAGAGKSTLTEALHTCRSCTTVDLSLWNLPRPLLLASALELSPRVAVATLSGNWAHASKLAQMLRMGALRRAVSRAHRQNTDLIVLDEGPVFGLTWLDVFHPHASGSEWAEWRTATVRSWATRLHTVVWVDAADATIVHRIRTRAKAHPVKDCSDQEINDFTARFRLAFTQVVGDLANAGKIRVMKIRTDDVTPDAMAIRLRAALRGSLHGR
jgi:hypothetical protein